jgi:hypothetical protein
MTHFRIVIEGESGDPMLLADATRALHLLTGFGHEVTEAHMEQWPDTVDDLLSGERESAPLGTVP